MIRRDRIRLRPARLAAACLTAALAAIAAVAVVEALAFGAWSRAAETLAAVEPGPPAATASVPFRYRGRTRFLTVAASSAELDAARRLPTDAVFARPAPLRDAYLRVLLRTQSRSHVVADVAAQLRAIREELGLDADEYVELIAVAVQDMRYGRPRTAFDLPVRSLLAGRGVCVDRSLLLAALLVHEGYDAGLWTLSTDNHVAVALRGTGPGYRRSGYAYIEATERSYVGEVPDVYAGFAGWEPTPRLIVNGRGTAYGADVETARIVGERRRAEAVAHELGAYGGYALRATGRWRETYLREAERGRDAASLATQLAGSVDDRPLAFATLEALRSTVADDGS